MDFALVNAAVLFATLVLFSIIAYKKNLLNFEGILIANIIGIAIFLFSGNNLLYFLAAVLFFSAAELATYYSGARKPRHEVRTAGNILGNSAIGLGCLLIGFNLGFFAAFASVLADKLSSEIGLLSRTKPRLITNFKPVPAGTDGGITLLGVAASAVGAAMIAAVHFALYADAAVFALIVASGIFGALVDSFFGAAFERKRLLNNDEVNLLGSLGGTAFAWFVGSLMII